MTRCPQCKVILYNKSGTCPLCHCVTEEITEQEQGEIRKMFGEGAPYPDAYRRQRFVRFALRLVFFIFAVAEALLILINYLTPITFCWSAITGVAFLYTYLFLLYWVKHDSAFAAKVGLQIIFTMLVLYEIDHMTGMYGWSLQWAIPGVILFGDAIAFFLMMLNRRRWHSYTLLLLLMGACSIAIFVLYFIGTITNIIMPVLCLSITGVYILATVTFGQRGVSQELKRRFHI